MSLISYMPRGDPFMARLCSNQVISKKNMNFSTYRKEERKARPSYLRSSMDLEVPEDKRT